ncbi:hypothetical protein PoB_004678200 [Plakobranchus ocellatus]|uniref:Secreted protein n=1 Tax=Plakobranchus ocellatus TaxID=259542 RepID=A0AAV4BLL1_9GAST|nr:hypothetical protein PoB_004678200 [Plakobranchus ocellatus]
MVSMLWVLPSFTCAPAISSSMILTWEDSHFATVPIPPPSAGILLTPSLFPLLHYQVCPNLCQRSGISKDNRTGEQGLFLLPPGGDP